MLTTRRTRPSSRHAVSADPPALSDHSVIVADVILYIYAPPAFTVSRLARRSLDVGEFAEDLQKSTLMLSPCTVRR